MWTYSRNNLSLFVTRLMMGGDDDPVLGRIHFHVGGTAQTLAPSAITADVEGLAVQDVQTRVQQHLDRVLDRVPDHQTVLIVRVVPMARTTDVDDRPTYTAWPNRPQYLELTCERGTTWQPSPQQMLDPQYSTALGEDEIADGDGDEGSDGDEDDIEELDEDSEDPDAEDEAPDPEDGDDDADPASTHGFGLDDAAYDRHVRRPLPTEPLASVHTRSASLDVVQPRGRNNSPAPRVADPRSRSTAMAQPDRRPREPQVRVVHVPAPAPASNEFERQAAALVLEIARQSVAQALAGATKREESHETQMAGLLGNLDRLTGQNAELTRAQYDRERSAYDAAERRREAELRELRRQMAEAQADAAEREQQLVATLTATTSQLAEARATAAAAAERAKRKIAEAASEEDKMTETLMGMVGPRLVDKFLPVTPPAAPTPPAQAAPPKPAQASVQPQRRQPLPRRDTVVYVDDDDAGGDVTDIPVGPRRPQALPVHAPPPAAEPAPAQAPASEEAGGINGMLAQLRTLADLPKPIRKVLMQQVKEQIGDDLFKTLRETLDEDQAE